MTVSDLIIPLMHFIAKNEVRKIAAFGSLFHSCLTCRCSPAFKYLRSGHIFRVGEIKAFLLLKEKKKTINIPSLQCNV